MDTVLIVAILYLLLVIAVGFWAHRRGMTSWGEHEYDIGDKSVHWFPIMVSTFSTASSAFVFVGLFGMGYENGISMMWYAILATMVGPVLFWVFGERLRDMSGKFGSYTLVEFLNSRFGDKKGYLGGIGALITTIFLFFYVGGQIRAAGFQFKEFFGWPMIYGALIMGIVIIVYTFLAGFRGVVWTDTLQGLTMVGAMAALAIVGVYTIGGFEELLSQLAAQDPALVSITGGMPWASTAFTIFLAGWIASGLAGMGNPQVAVRPMGMRDSTKMKISGVTAAIIYAPTYATAVLAGTITRALVPDIAEVDAAFGVLVGELFPPIIAGIMLGGLLAAIMSTADSVLLTSSAEFIRNIYKKINPDSSSRQRLFYTRLLVTIMGVAAIYAGVYWEEYVFWFILFAWGGLGSAFLPVMAFSLFWEKITWEGAVAGVVSGFGTVVVWLGIIEPIYDFGIYEAIPGIIVSTLAILVVSKLTDPPRDVLEEIDI